MQKEVSSAIKKLISRKEMIEEGLWIGRDLLSAIKIIPQHLKWFVKETARRGHAFEVIQRGYEEEYRSVASSLKFVGFAFLAGLLLLSGVILVGNPGLAGMRHQNFAVGFMWVGSLLMFIRGYWGIRK